MTIILNKKALQVLSGSKSVVGMHAPGCSGVVYDDCADG